MGVWPLEVPTAGALLPENLSWGCHVMDGGSMGCDVGGGGGGGVAMK